MELIQVSPQKSYFYFDNSKAKFGYIFVEKQIEGFC